MNFDPRTSKLTNSPSEAMRWLEALTAGGSEFHDDPENCYFSVRKRLDSNHKSISKLVLENRKLRKQIENQSL